MKKFSVAFSILNLILFFTLYGWAGSKVSSDFLPNSQKEKARVELLKELDRILNQNKDLKKLKSYAQNQLKLAGGTQDGGGGGDFIELEISYLLNLQIKKLHLYRSTMIQLEIFSAEQMRNIEQVVLLGPASQKICILALEKTDGKECEGFPYRTVIAPSAWKSLNDRQKSAQVMQEIFRVFDPGQPEKSMLRKLKLLESVISEQPEVFQRIDLIKTTSGTTKAIFDGRREFSASYVLEKSDKGFTIKVAEKEYTLDSQSAFFKVDICNVGANQAAIVDQLGTSIFYRELKNLVLKCERQLKNGANLQTFWVSDKTNLVINCR